MPVVSIATSGQHQSGLERQRPIDGGEQQQRKHRRNKRNRQCQTEAGREAQRRARGQTQCALSPGRALSRHTTASSSGHRNRAAERVQRIALGRERHDFGLPAGTDGATVAQLRSSSPRKTR